MAADMLNNLPQLQQQMAAYAEQKQQKQQHADNIVTAFLMLLQASQLGRPVEQMKLFRKSSNMEARRMALQWEAQAFHQAGLKLTPQQRQQLLGAKALSLLCGTPQLSQVRGLVAASLRRTRNRGRLPGTLSWPSPGQLAERLAAKKAPAAAAAQQPFFMPVLAAVPPGEANADQAPAQQPAGLADGGDDDNAAGDHQIDAGSFVPPAGGFMALLMSD